MLHLKRLIFLAQTILQCFPDLNISPSNEIKIPLQKPKPIDKLPPEVIEILSKKKSKKKNKDLEEEEEDESKNFSFLVEVRKPCVYIPAK
jgi:hypothetical protein